MKRILLVILGAFLIGVGGLAYGGEALAGPVPVGSGESCNCASTSSACASWKQANCSSSTTTTTTPTSTPTPTPVPATGGDDSCGGAIFGFKPWYDGACVGGQVKPEKEKDESAIIKFVWTIVLNVIFDLSLAIGYIAVAMVIYGGYMYIMSSGEPVKAAKGQKTLTSATIGVIIAMGATVIVNTIQGVLGITSGSLKQDGIDVNGILSWFYAMAGLVAVIFIIKGGVTYLTSRGDPGKVQQATRSLIFSVVGLIIVILAAVITSFITGAVGAAV